MPTDGAYISKIVILGNEIHLGPIQVTEKMIVDQKELPARRATLADLLDILDETKAGAFVNTINALTDANTRITDLEAQLEAVTSEKDSAQAQVTALQEQVAALTNAPAPSTVDVIGDHALALKMGAVNALRGPDATPYPATAEMWQTVREQYRDRAVQLALIPEANRTAEQLQEITNINAGFDYANVVDAAAGVIRLAGDAADPIATDSRWPAMPGA